MKFFCEVTDFNITTSKSIRLQYNIDMIRFEANLSMFFNKDYIYEDDFEIYPSTFYDYLKKINDPLAQYSDTGLFPHQFIENEINDSLDHYFDKFIKTEINNSLHVQHFSLNQDNNCVIGSHKLFEIQQPQKRLNLNELFDNKL